MKILTLVARLLLGLAFVVFGLNGFFNFLSMGPMPTGVAAQFIGALIASHHFSFVAGLMIATGILFLINRFVPLALTLIGPVLVNILLFHILTSPQGIVPGLFLTICWFIVFYAHRAAFAGIFTARS